MVSPCCIGQKLDTEVTQLESRCQWFARLSGDLRGSPQCVGELGACGFNAEVPLPLWLPAEALPTCWVPVQAYISVLKAVSSF